MARFQLTIGPGVIRLGEEMVDIVLSANQLEDMCTEEFLACHRRLDLCRAPACAVWIGEVDVIGEHGVDFLGNG